MFIVASFSVVGGLKASVDRLEGTFSSQYNLLTKPGEIELMSFDPDEIASVLDRYAYGSFVGVTTNVTSIPTTVFYFRDDSGLLPSLGHPTGNEVFVPSSIDFGALEVESAVSMQQVEATGILISDTFPDDWILGSRDLVDNLTGRPGTANFAIVDSLSSEQQESLAANGFSVQSMTGIVDFLGQSVRQIQSDLTLILVPCAFVIAVLSYGYVASETYDRRHDIGILKTIGAGRLRIMELLVSNALVIGLWGGAIGVALGSVLSYAMSTAISTAFSSTFLMRADMSTLAIAFVATLIASVAGSLPPSLRMTLSEPVNDLRGERR